jgi:hypothetical protein
MEHHSRDDKRQAPHPRGTPCRNSGRIHEQNLRDTCTTRRVGETHDCSNLLRYLAKWEQAFYVMAHFGYVDDSMYSDLRNRALFQFTFLSPD